MPNIEILKLIKLEKQQVTWLVLTVSGSSAFSVVPLNGRYTMNPAGEQPTRDCCYFNKQTSPVV